MIHPKIPAQKPSEEIITIVDEKNNEISTTTRSKMREMGLPHRATYILVFNGKNELFIQKRTATKDIYPGYYDIAAGGVVLAGENYEESAKRELSEELGIEAPLTFHFDNYYADKNNKVWGRIFSCVHDGPMTLQKEEIESGLFLTPEKILTMSNKEPFTPDGVIILRRFLSR
jgi:8-oxo-dGTP pyrophosphatase MutT (NUDIX family)